MGAGKVLGRGNDITFLQNFFGLGCSQKNFEGAEWVVGLDKSPETTVMKADSGKEENHLDIE